MDGHLIGKVTERTSANEYRVHFGSFFSGVASSTTRELARVKLGPKALAKKRLGKITAGTCVLCRGTPNGGR